ncbi:hypothetical protein [Halorubrum sp. Ea8]|uniref:hypothetical protein n=1 Tax=Halorubrum sp. Ea8 TaxID=1383841 RepID=UPI000B993716|nr:hypothetical protein [Halorubrum sp. Ea8]OYR51440.1 hypothetical protein DJ74_03875 [Halorubrum sp. Ea8]
MYCSRRRALQLLGASAVTTSTAGCLNSGSLDEYALIADELDLSSVGRPYLKPDLTEIEAVTRVDFSAEMKAQYVSELFDQGSVTIKQWPLVGRDEWGRETKPYPTFCQRNNSFYHVRIADERRLERERWHFAVERTDETPPDDATIETRPFDLSTQDERVLDAALDAVYAGNDGFLGDPEFDELQTVEFHHGLDPDASDLIPSAPFDFVEVNEAYFRPVTEQRRVQVPKWTYTVTEITQSRREFDEYARTEIVEHDLRSSGLSESARSVIDDAISEDPRRYEEGAPPSDGLSEVLEALNIASDLEPIDSYEDRVDFRNVVAEYQDTIYRFDLIVTP